jgi:magnesium transporter
LVISTGGNTGNQSATLIITALVNKDIAVHDWQRIVRRELMMGLLLGGFLALFGLLLAVVIPPDSQGVRAALVLPVTLLLVVVCGNLFGSTLPLVFQRLGWDPALMSNPFVAGLIDIFGIIIYINVAILLLSRAG